MPKAKIKNEGLLDSWGRKNNRMNTDKVCPECGKTFKPLHAKSKYCSHPCMWKNNGKNSRRKPESWWINGKGYIEGRIWLPDGTKLNVKKHRFIMEGVLGRPLLPDEDVHHIDGDKQNNKPENLQLIGHGKHSTESNKKRNYKKGYNLNLTEEQRTVLSLRAIGMQLNKLGLEARYGNKKA